ncbi:F-box/kelch-repeat protein At3g23880-like [Bidens hawaiensis]|uniref:F-box/kelch-repeat protein At3g23880-like n=1 Tax=Bidens hawaiensis TaxID=980011 RepID=UPI00404A199E
MIGFGYGATEDDLKLVRFDKPDHPNRFWYKYDVLDLKTGLWSMPQEYPRRDFFFLGGAGLYLNDFLYWLTTRFVLALNVKKMVFSNIELPLASKGALNACSSGLPFGTIGGCLCVISKIGTVRFDVWLMKEECSWMKAHSFTFGSEVNCFKVFNPMCILSNGKILMTNSSLQLAIYDTSKDSYKMINGLATLDDFKRINTMSDFKKMFNIYEFKHLRSIEYVESLVSPSDICFI